MAELTPVVSIGMPVFNGEGVIRNALDSLLEQSFHEFEIVISDNASIDGTHDICREYAAQDSRIRLFRQPKNIGATENFQFVLEKARAPFFMWAAGDDVRSEDFLEENVRFLSKNPEYVASTCPNCFEGQEREPGSWVSFSLEGDVEQRFLAFFDNCWVSHGIFYSLIRRDILVACPSVGRSFIASDWAVDLFLAREGPIHRTDKGLAVFGRHGLSAQKDAFRFFRNVWIERFLPFYRLSCEVVAMTRGFSVRSRLLMIKVLLLLNLSAGWAQLRTLLYVFYCRYLRSVFRPIKAE